MPSCAPDGAAPPAARRVSALAATTTTPADEFPTIIACVALPRGEHAARPNKAGSSNSCASATRAARIVIAARRPPGDRGAASCSRKATPTAALTQHAPRMRREKPAAFAAPERTCAACPATSGHEKVISTRKERSGSSASELID